MLTSARIGQAQAEAQQVKERLVLSRLGAGAWHRQGQASQTQSRPPRDGSAAAGSVAPGGGVEPGHMCGGKTDELLI